MVGVKIKARVRVRGMGAGHVVAVWAGIGRLGGGHGLLSPGIAVDTTLPSHTTSKASLWVGGWGARWPSSCER